MLKDLKIKNYVLVKDMNISFIDGLTVLTGETGAGKSVIAGALQLVLGEQLKSDVFYDKNASVVLEAIFDVTNLMELDSFKELTDKYGIELTEVVNEFFIFREIKPDGRSSIFINGRKSTNAIVKEFRNILLDFHSQRDQHSLFDEDIQLFFLDNFANLLNDRTEFQKYYFQWQELIKKLNKYQDEIQKNKEKIMLYQYQIDELETANLKENEEAELDSEYTLLSNAKEILNLFFEMKADLFEADKTVYDILGLYKNRLDNYSANSKLIKDIVLNLNTCLTAMEDISASSRYIDDEIPTDEKRLEEVEIRLKTIFDLKTKYKKTVPQLNEYLSEMKNFITGYEQNVETELGFKKEIAILQQKTTDLAIDLEKKRKEAGAVFEANIIASLRNLAINDAEFKINIDRICDFNNDVPIGIDSFNTIGFNNVKYVFSANKGMPLQELKATISGGELSRLLLVIKAILAKKLPQRTIIFDEIDSGIGGKTANTLGEFIKKLSESHQILCISHLPQIAAVADQHLKIEKLSESEKSVITLKLLDKNDRREEIARMLSGNITQTSLKHADEMLASKVNNRLCEEE